MSLYFNDLSADGKFQTSQAALEALLHLYEITRKLSLRLVVTKSLLYRPAFGGMSIHDVIVGAGKSHRALLLSWLAKSGPFVEEDQLQVENDLWWHGKTEVTDQGLGEAARRLSKGHSATSYSFSLGCQNAFDRTPLAVVQGFPDEPISTLELPNIWSLDGLRDFAQGLRTEPTDWEGFIAECIQRYDLIQIDAENFSHALNKHPFNGNVVRRSFALLDVLNRIAHGLGADGSLSEASMQLVTEHFQGEKAWFSDEQPNDPNVFRFVDNNNDGERVDCSWHGKIKTPQFRLHFQWPVPVGQRYIKVLYLGEKLTKW